MLRDTNDDVTILNHTISLFFLPKLIIYKIKKLYTILVWGL